MTVEEARAALAEAELAYEKAKGTGVSNVVAASKALSAARRALATAEKAEAAGVNVGGLSRAEQISTIRQAEYTAAQEEAGKGEKPTVPPEDAEYTYDYVWRPEPGGRGGYWSLVRYPKIATTKTPVVVTDDNNQGDTTGYKTVGGILYFNGQPFTGSYNGQNYQNGKVVAADNTGYKTVDGVLYFNGQPFTGNYNGQNYQNGKVFTASSSGDTTGYKFVDGKLYFNGSPFTGAYNGQNYEGGVIKATSVVTQPGVMTAGQQDIYSIVVDRLNRYNLGSLAPLIKKLAIEGATEATIMLRLQDEPLYQERFKANQTRISKGLKALTPSEYLTLEDDYRQVLRAYGLTQFDNDSYVSQFLANDISVSELSNRVVAAVQRVRNADPAVSSMLKSYYGISNNDLVAYVLDPNQQFQKIERQIAASEIGVAAGRQGINIGVPVAEQLAAQGISQAEAQRGYATIADILPTAKKLSDIYGNVLEGYDLAEAEQEVFNQLASAQRKRRALTEREVAAFSGTSGLGRTSLTQQSGGQFQNPERTHRPRQRTRPKVGASLFPRTELWPAN